MTLKISNFKFGVELELEVSCSKIENSNILLPDWIVHFEHCGSEIVSPPLCGYNGLLAVRRQLIKLWDRMHAGSIKFYDCGLHVHVDIQHFNLGHAKRMLKLCSRYDNTMFSMMDKCRRDNHFCRHLKYTDLKINKCINLKQLQELQEYDRYSAVNLYAFSKHGTVEFRYASGSADWQKIYSLTSLYLRIVAFAYSDLEIPPKEKTSYSPMNMESNRNMLFNTLGIRGGVRRVLNHLVQSSELAPDIDADYDDDYDYDEEDYDYDDCSTRSRQEIEEFKKPVKGLRKIN